MEKLAPPMDAIGQDTPPIRVLLAFPPNIKKNQKPLFIKMVNDSPILTSASL